MKVTLSNRLLALGLVSALGFTGSLAAAPGGKGPKGGKDPERRLQMMKKHLGLSDQQVTQIRAIHKKNEDQHQQLREKLRTARRELRELIANDSSSRDAVKAKMQEVSSVKVEKRMLWFDQHREVQAVLTPAQKAKLRKHMEERRKDYRKGKGKHKGRGHGC